MQTPTQRLLAQIEADKQALQQQSDKMLKQHAANLNRLFSEELTITSGVMASQLGKLEENITKLAIVHQLQQQRFKRLFWSVVAVTTLGLSLFGYQLWTMSEKADEWSARALKSQEMLEEAQKQAASNLDWYKKTPQTPSVQKPKNGK